MVFSKIFEKVEDCSSLEQWCERGKINHCFFIQPSSWKGNCFDTDSGSHNQICGDNISCKDFFARKIPAFCTWNQSFQITFDFSLCVSFKSWRNPFPLYNLGSLFITAHTLKKLSNFFNFSYDRTYCRILFRPHPHKPKRTHKQVNNQKLGVDSSVNPLEDDPWNITAFENIFSIIAFFDVFPLLKTC